MGVAQEQWPDPGPVVRPYAMTSGRTTPVRGTFDLISIVKATRPPEQDDGLHPELALIIRHSQEPVSVAELAAVLDLPAGTVMVLLGDLLAQQLIVTRSPTPARGVASRPVIEAVIHGLSTQ